ncbi:MAG: hypothetical protein KF745_05470 [Phycisphaeraceae bacterium]|nr:hypothetical protein [Phycisphaeraceae bacterium]
MPLPHTPNHTAWVRSPRGASFRLKPVAIGDRQYRFSNFGPDYAIMTSILTVLLPLILLIVGVGRPPDEPITPLVTLGAVAVLGAILSWRTLYTYESIVIDAAEASATWTRHRPGSTKVSTIPLRKLSLCKCLTSREPMGVHIPQSGFGLAIIGDALCLLIASDSSARAIEQYRLGLPDLQIQLAEQAVWRVDIIPPGEWTRSPQKSNPSERRCPTCGYDCRGIDTAAPCPECGASLPSAPSP